MIERLGNWFIEWFEVHGLRLVSGAAALFGAIFIACAALLVVFVGEAIGYGTYFLFIGLFAYAIGWVLEKIN